MNFKEIIDTTKIVLKRDHFENGKLGSDIKYGKDSWTPSPSIWDHENVPWNQITCNFKDMKFFPGNLTMLSFLRTVIEKYYSNHEIDIETYINSSFTSVEKKRRLRKRGIHIEPTPQLQQYENMEEDFVEAVGDYVDLLRGRN